MSSTAKARAASARQRGADAGISEAMEATQARPQQGFADKLDLGAQSHLERLMTRAPRARGAPSCRPMQTASNVASVRR